MISDNTKKMMVLALDLDPSMLAQAAEILVNGFDSQDEQIEEQRNTLHARRDTAHDHRDSTLWSMG